MERATFIKSRRSARRPWPLVAADLPAFIDDVYNATRLHSALEYLSPDQFEERNAPALSKQAA